MSNARSLEGGPPRAAKPAGGLARRKLLGKVSPPRLLSVTALRALFESHLWPTVLVMGLVGLVGILGVQLWVERRRPRWRLARHRRQGSFGEKLAEGLLTGSGYRIEGRQVPARYTLRVDGEPWEVSLRADFVVRRGARRFVAEAKSGELAGRLDTAATRRQIVEYCLAFDVDGVLLVDTHRRRISLVQLEHPTGHGSLGRLLVPAVVLVLLGLALWAAVRP